MVRALFHLKRGKPVESRRSWTCGIVAFQLFSGRSGPGFSFLRHSPEQTCRYFSAASGDSSNFAPAFFASANCC
jgi:hypothetical protein